MSRLIKLHEYGASPKPFLVPVSNIIDVKMPTKGMLEKTKTRAIVSYQGAWAGAFEAPKKVQVIETLDEIMSLVNRVES